MANVRFGLAASNKACRTSPSASYPILCNGNPSYPSAPARVESASGPMENLFSQDRYTTWGVPAGANNLNGTDVAVDLRVGGGPVTFDTLAILNYRALAAFPFYAYFYVASTTSYPTSTDWTQIAYSMLIGSRDRVNYLSTPASSRWLRIRFENTSASSGFSVGKFFAGAITDLGFLYARATETVVTPRVAISGYGDQPSITKTGDQYRRFLLDYPNVDVETLSVFRDSILSSSYATHPFIYFAPNGYIWECVADEPEQAFDHVWSPPDRFSFSFRFRSLP